MNATIMKGERSKLLAVFVALAMLVCAAAMVMPSSDAATGIKPTEGIDYGDSVDMNQGSWDALVTNETIEVTGNVVKLLADQTWNLTGNITDADGTIDLNGNNLKITGNYAFSVTFAGDEVGAALVDTNGTTAGNLCIDGSKVSFIGAGTSGSWAVEAMNIAQVLVQNGATLNVEKTDTASPTGTVWHTDADSYTSQAHVEGNNVVLFVDNSTVNFVNNIEGDSAGVQTTAIVATNNSVINADLGTVPTLSVYASLTDSRITGDNIGFYGAVLSGNSSVDATQVGIYSGIAESAYEDIAVNDLVIGEGSSVTADKIINSLSKGTPVGTNIPTISGKGSITGGFTIANGSAGNFTLDGVSVSGSADSAVTILTGENPYTVPEGQDFQASGIQYSADRTIATVGSGEAFITAAGTEGVKKIILGNDITVVSEDPIKVGDKIIDLDGNVLTLEDTVLIVEGGSIDVTEGATFSFVNVVVLKDVGESEAKYLTDSTSTTEFASSGAQFYSDYSESVSDSGSTEYTYSDAIFPDMKDGSIATITNPSGRQVDYTVFHADTEVGVVQFGVAASLTYNGLNQAGEIRNAAVVSFETDYPATAGQPKAYVYNPEDYHPEDPQAKDPATMLPEEFGVCKDVIEGGYGLYINFTMNSVSSQTVNVEASVTIMMYPGEPGASVNIDDMSYGDTDNTVDIGYSDFDKNTSLEDYITALGEETVTVTITGGSLTEPLVLAYPFADAGKQLSRLMPGTYTYTATFPAKNANYKDFTTVEETFDVNRITAGVDVSAPENGYKFYGVTADRIVSYDDKTLYSAGVSGNEIAVIGGIYWINDFMSIAQNYTANSNQGYFMVMKIKSTTDDYGFHYQFSDGASYYVDAGQSDYIFKYIGNDISAIRERTDLTLTITPDEDSGYNGNEYRVVFENLEGELFRMTTTGYEATDDGADKAIAAEGVSVSDADAETMWIVFDTTDSTGDITAELTFQDKVIYSQKGTIDKAVMIWYFSFLETNGSYIGDEDVNTDATAYKNYLEYVKKYCAEQDANAPAPGMYTMTISSADGTTIAEGTVEIEGVADTGFEYFADDATMGIKDVNSTFTKTDAIDKTLWFTWYQKDAHDNVTITISKNGVDADVIAPYVESLITEENPTGTLGSGYRTFYASFEDQLSRYAEDPIGTYTVTVKSGETQIFTGEVIVAAEDSYVEIKNPDGTGLAEDYLLGKTEAQLQSIPVNGITILRPGMGSQVNVTVTGQLVYIPAGGYPGYQADSPAGYYLALNANSRGWNWEDYRELEVTLPNGDEIKTFTSANVDSGEWDGTFVMYLGNTIEGIEAFNLTVDFDGKEGPFFQTYTYTITPNMSEIEYTIVLKDKFNDDLTYDAPKDGKFQLPNGAGPGFQYWVDENGDIRYGGSTFNVNSTMDSAPIDGVITLTAVYAGVSEHTIQYWIGAAPEYVYPAGYTYNGWFDIDGTTVYVVYSQDEYLAGEPMMNDLARYLGALNYASEGDIVSIYFGGVTYVWVDDLLQADGEPFKGSKWAVEDENGEAYVGGVHYRTLVSDLTDFYLQAFESKNFVKYGATFELTNQAGDRVAMNYSLAVESDGTGSGDDGYALPRQLSDYYMDVVVNDDNTVTVSLKVDADKIEGYVNVLSAVQFTVYDWSSYKNVSFDDYLGVVFITEPDENGTVASIVISYNADYQVTVSGLVTLTVPIDTVDLSTLDDGSTTQDESATKTE